MEKKKLDIAYLKRLAGKGAKLVLNLMLLPLLPIALLAGLLGAVFKDTVKETATETANIFNHIFTYSSEREKEFFLLFDS